MKLKSILFFSSILLLSACSTPVVETPAPDLTQIKTEIQALEDAFAAGLMADDADAVVAYYADDAVNMSSNEPMAVGKAAILNRIQTNMAKDTTNSKEVFEVMDIFVSGDYVIETGKSTSTDESGKVTAGKYMSLFEKRDGKYVCIRDIWNNDAPVEKN